VKTRFLTWAERSCTRCNCSVVPAVIFLGIVGVALVAAHRTGVREFALVFGITLAAAVVAAVMAAGLVYRTRRRPAVPSRVRQPAVVRPVTRRAAAGLLGVPRPSGMCAEECGRPAVTEVAGCKVCQPCADWLAAYLPADREAAGTAVMPPAGLLDGGFRPAGAEPLSAEPLPAELAEFEKDLQP
jgi:hypothetical protein